jgi:hypothetical protein
MPDDKEKIDEAVLRATIMKGTIEHLIAEMTPERLAVFADAWLAKVFGEMFSTWRWSTELDAIVKPALLEQIKSPVFFGRVQEAIQKGLDKAVADLPEKVAKEITDAAIASVKARLEPRR